MASEVLEKEAQPMVQTPMGPKPTVASMVNQGLQQAAAQRGAPNMQGIGQQAQVGAQIQAQQQQQQQQMANDPRAIAALAAQMMQARQQPPNPAEAGIGRLPVQMQFKEGGIIGYAGGEYMTPEESDAADPQERKKLEVLELLKRMSPLMYFGEEAGKIARRGKSIEEYYGEPGAAVAPTAPAQRTSRMISGRPEPSRYGYQPNPEAIAIGATPARGPAGAQPPAQQGIPNTPEWQQFVQDLQTSGMPMQDQMAAISDALRSGVTAPKWSGSRAAAPTGIQAALPTNVTRPTIQDLVTAGKTLVPDTDFKQYEETRRRIAAEREARLKAQPDLEAEGIASLRQAGQEREKLLERQREGDTFNRIKAALSDLATRGASYQTLENAIIAREDSARVAAFNEQQAIIKLKAARQAKEMGDLDRAEALEKEFQQDREKAVTARNTATNIAAQVSSQLYQSDMSYVSQRMNDASQERQRAVEREIRYRELGNAQKIQMLNTAQARVTEAYAKWEDVRKKHPIASNMTPEMLKDPNMKALHDKYVQEAKTVYDNSVLPAVSTRDRLEEQVFGSPLFSSRSQPEPGGRAAPKAGDVVDGWKFKGGNPADRNNWEKS